MPKHVFFDLDKTLTASRSSMAPAHQELFEELCKQKDVIVVTGGTVGQIREQVTPRFNGKYILLAQSGNEVILKDGSALWKETLTSEQVVEIEKFVKLLRVHFNEKVRDESDLTENRGAQFAFSVIGFHENIERKYAFDPGDARRQEALKKFGAEREALLKVGVEVVPAGTTNFSFIPAGKHKGHNVGRFVEHMKWEKEECVYVGDALFPGGNDESVVGVVPTKQVGTPDETFDFIAQMLN